MVSIKEVRALALSFPETDEHPHFEKTAFRVRKKIFATVSVKDRTLTLKLTPAEQSVFCAFDSSVIYPVPGGWGKMGYTIVNLRKAARSLFRDAITVAYCTVAPRKLAEKYSRE